MSKSKICLTLLTTAISLLPFFAFAQTPLKVCPNPAAPCINKHGGRFAEYELSFRLPAKFKPNTFYKSEPFYAVILKDRIKVTEKEECDGGEYHQRIENERKQIQKSFPDRK